MTNSDSTPDFSWLNEKNKTEEASKPADSGSIDSESASEGSSQDESANAEEEANEPAESELVNPAAETWVPESPVFEKPFGADFNIGSAEVTNDVSAEASADDSFSGEDKPADVDSPQESPSVFDDETEEATVDPTLIMPGRQLTETENALLNTSTQPEDATVVLQPEETVKAESQGELFADAGESLPVEEEMSLNDESLNEKSTAETESAADNEGAADFVDASAEQTESDEQVETQAASGSDASPDQSTERKLGTGMILLISYASAMTLIVLFLLMNAGGGSSINEHLESLPDVDPEPAGELSYVPVKAGLPSGHVLKIGEKQRYGNIEVEPLKVVQEPIEFSHYDPTSNAKRPPTSPVFKLWVKFTNVSKDQQIAPLDGNLLLRWVTNSEQQREFSNQYLFADGATSPEEEISTYRHSKTSDWDLSNQNLGQVLEPGESYETYIASTEALPEEIPENLNWRLQFRKGFSPNGGGVTTVIDVSFQKNQITANDEPI